MTKERVLIVDDEVNILTSLEDILTDEGYEVATTNDGLDALEIIQSDPPDLVLLDIWVPGMDGIEVLKTVKTYHPAIEVVVMSGHGTIETAMKATKLGASDFIEKPFSLEQLTHSVESALQHKKIQPVQGEGDLFRKTELPFCFEKLVELKQAIKSASRHNNAILVQGEPGTGKELIVQTIHRQSKYSNRPWLKLNCAVRPMPSIQAQLFRPLPKGLNGHAKSNGTKTNGAKSIDDKVVYLTNIDALSKSLQEKLALALAGKEVKRADRKLEFLPSRLFCASSKDLACKVKKGQFNKDLYEQLQESSIKIPPLREYSENIPSLIKTYFLEFAENGPAQCPEIHFEAMKYLCQYTWPGNIKELRSVLEKLAITASHKEQITVRDLPPFFKTPHARSNGRSSIEVTISDSQSVEPSNPVKRSLTQRTLKRSVVLCGSGLHSGIKTGLILQPLPPGSGIIFGDISSGNTIPAKLENIQSTDYSTCLRKGNSSVATIEHILAALHMYRITNLLIKIGDEAPVMDGSAKDFCQLIEDGELEDQGDPYEEIIIDKPLSFGSKDKAFISIEPCDHFKVSYHMEYPAPIGVQDFTYEFKGSDSFKDEIAPARTFGFLEDVAHLTRMGFGTGGKLDNFILLGDGKVLNTPLRFENEFVRHKILDIIGDLFLLGKPIRGFVKAHKSGHTQNIGLLKEIQKNLD